MAELKKMTPKSDRYDAKFMVLAESVKHHIEEEGQMMPKAEESQIDLAEVEPKAMTQKEKLPLKLAGQSTNGKRKRSSSQGRPARRR